MGRQKLSNAFEIFGGVDAGRGVVSRHHLDGHAA